MNKNIFPNIASDMNAIPIAVRAYVRPLPSSNEAEKTENKSRSRKRARASEYSLIFDCETTTDATQKLRFGSYQFRKSDELIEEGLFFDADALGEREINILQNYAENHGVKCCLTREFVEQVLFYKAYERRAAIIGFNLPFDISRLATKCSSARGKTMKGGFSFTLSENKRWPHNRWEEQFYVGLDLDAQVEYGAKAECELLDQRLKAICEESGERETARRLGISRGLLKKARQKGCAAISEMSRKRLRR